MIASIKAAVARFVRSPRTQTVARHAVTAAAGVVLAAYIAGGPAAITTGVAIAAGSAAVRVAWLGVLGAVGKAKARQAAKIAALVAKELAAQAAASAAQAGAANSGV